MEFYDVFDEIYNDESYGFIADRVINAVQSKSFLEEKYNDIFKWRHEAREFVWNKLGHMPAETPFDELVTERIDFGAYIRRKIYFNSAPGCRIPAYLLVPKGLTAPAPGVVALHDHGAMFYWGKEKSTAHKNCNPVLEKYIDGLYSGRPVASVLAERGYVVLVIDSLFFGERSFKVDRKAEFQERLKKFKYESADYINEYNTAEFEIESDLVRTVFHAGYTFMGIRTRDDMASVSYLCSLPEVDAGRIGCIGLSMGGHRSGWLSAMDDRVKCAVIVGWMARQREMTRYRLSNVPWLWVVPGLYGHLDYPDVVSISAPKSLMVLQGKRDALYPHETGEKAVELVHDVYEKAGAGDKFTSEFYDVEHVFNLEMQDKAYTWMDSLLKP